MTINVKALYILVWRFREEAEAYWPTPNQDFSWRFANCEINEAMDIWIRLNMESFKRNRLIAVTQDDLLNELADTAIMVLTALGPGQRIDKVNGIHGGVDLDTLCRWIPKTWDAYTHRKRQPVFWVQQSIAIVTAISQYPGMELDERLVSRLERIKEKHEPHVIAEV